MWAAPGPKKEEEEEEEEEEAAGEEAEEEEDASVVIFHNAGKRRRRRRRCSVTTTMKTGAIKAGRAQTQTHQTQGSPSVAWRTARCHAGDCAVQDRGV